MAPFYTLLMIIVSTFSFIISFLASWGLSLSDEVSNPALSITTFTYCLSNCFLIVNFWILYLNS